MQRPNKDNEACSGGKTKRDKSVEFNRSVKEANIMEHYYPIPKKKKEGKKLDIKRKSEIAKADPEGFGNTYGIDHFKMGDAKHDLDDSG